MLISHQMFVSIWAMTWKSILLSVLLLFGPVFRLLGPVFRTQHKYVCVCVPLKILTCLSPVFWRFQNVQNSDCYCNCSNTFFILTPNKPFQLVGFLIKIVAQDWKIFLCSQDKRRNWNVTFRITKMLIFFFNNLSFLTK